MHSTIKLTIPEPCSQDWNNMSATGNGKFCASCNKCVGDYTHFTDQQLIAYFSKTTAPACGRFTTEQLNRVMVVQQQTTHRKFIPQLIFSAALAFGLVNKADAQQATPPTIQTQPEIKLQPEKKSLPTTISNNSNYIYGKVVDGKTNTPMDYAAVEIMGADIGAFTESDGSFKIMIPDSLVGKEVILLFTYIHYDSVQVKTSTKKLPAIADVSLHLSPGTILTGLIIEVKQETPWQKFKHKLFHRRKASISN